VLRNSMINIINQILSREKIKFLDLHVDILNNFKNLLEDPPPSRDVCSEQMGQASVIVSQPALSGPICSIPSSVECV
jgi:hypothetical protein